VTAADRPYGKFYDFYSVSLETFGSTHVPKLHLNRQDPNDLSPNVPNANDTGTLKHTATTPHVVSNAPGAILPLIVPAKINLTRLHVSYAVVIIQ